MDLNGLLKSVIFFNFWFVLASCSSPEIPLESLNQTASEARNEFYLKSVRPILDNRCVSCHSCYTAPCQLNLADHEGIRRGVTKAKLYDGSRLVEADLTRLGIDAKSAPEWWTKGFRPVANEGENSLLIATIEQRRKNLTPVNDTVKESAECPADEDEMEDFIDDHPEKGMPYGLPGLSDKEAGVLHRWVQAGFPTLTPDLRANLKAAAPIDQIDVERWENLLNQKDPKSQLVARYLFEHLYLASVEFRDQSAKPMNGEVSFYQLVRSRTEGPIAPDVIATRRPFDDPKSLEVFYRFQRINQTLSHKNHIVITLDDKKWDRYQELFYAKAWSLDKSPTYNDKTKSNPFLVFQAIPAESRYQFLLDDSRYFVSAFIKGTVCEGEAAVNVIEERFFIFFLDPKSGMSQQSDSFISQIARDLAIPAAEGVLDNFYWSYKSSQMEFVKERQKAFSKLYPNGLSLGDIWDGDGSNSQAALTVMRHYDNSYITQGAVGGVPKTSWVMDYTIFERMYYLLVAGFDVYGNVFHQLSTRLYMDNLRVESEDIFLSLLPVNDRQVLRQSWYRGEWAKKKMEWLNPFGGVSAQPRINYTSNDRKKEVIEKILRERLGPKVVADPTLDHCCGPFASSSIVQKLKPLTETVGGFVSLLPDITLLLEYIAVIPLFLKRGCKATLLS